MLFRFLLPALMIVSASAQAQSTDDGLKAVIGVGYDQLKSCQSDADCVAVNDFLDCCRMTSVNVKYRTLVEQNHGKLFSSLASPDTQARCRLLECQAPSVVSVCENMQCQVR